MRLNLGLNSLKKFGIDLLESYKMKQKIGKKYNINDLKKARISVLDNTFNNFIKLQTPQQLGVWGDTAFITTFNPDFNIVINKPNPFVPLSNNIDTNWLLHIEPPGYIRKLGLAAPHITEKFGRVYTCDPELYEQGGKYIASPPYVHWHLALSSYTNNADNMVYDYDFLKGYDTIPDKNIVLASINSNMNDLPGHKLRADFVTAMCDNNVNFDLYGTSNWAKFKQYKGPTIFGKWPIYSKAKYVLAIENEISPLYWTEKFTDAILCYSMPIYYGSDKISDYFPEGSYIPLDINKKSAIDELKSIINSDYYEKNLPALIEARNLILNKHNLFNFLDTEINNR